MTGRISVANAIGRSIVVGARGLALVLLGTAVLGPCVLPALAGDDIKIGQTTAYSGPFSAWSNSGKVQTGYFQMINEQGGINGHKISFLSLDDAYSPPKTVEQTRRLVESEEVLFLLSSLGAASNTAVQKYLNANKVPQLFVQSGAAKWADPQNYPWTMGWMPSFANEGAIYARHILATMPDARIAVFYQNDDFGKDYLRGFELALGDKASSLIVARASYLSTDPTIDSQIVQVKASGANVLFNVSSPKFAAQSIRKVHELDWKPTQFLVAPSAIVNTVMKPAGAEASTGVISANYLKDPGNATFADDPGVRDYRAFIAKYAPGVDPEDSNGIWGYSAVQTAVQVLRQCGDDLSRDNIMKQAANLQNLELPMMLPGIKINTSSTDYRPIEEEQMMKFDGRQWQFFGQLQNGALPAN
jgi:branched-chain amino acid transport system substrate-binding protein